MRRYFFIVCFLVIGVLGAQFAYAENQKHKRFDAEKHVKFLEEKKAKREQLDIKLKNDSEEIDRRIAEMKKQQDIILKDKKLEN